MVWNPFGGGIAPMRHLANGYPRLRALLARQGRHRQRRLQLHGVDGRPGSDAKEAHPGRSAREQEAQGAPTLYSASNAPWMVRVREYAVGWIPFPRFC